MSRTAGLATGAGTRAVLSALLDGPFSIRYLAALHASARRAVYHLATQKWIAIDGDRGDDRIATITDAGRAALTKQRRDAQVLAALLQRDATAIELAEITELSRAAIHDALRKLSADRKARCRGRGASAVWSAVVGAPSNVIPIRTPQTRFAGRMLPVVRRDDCVHEADCTRDFLDEHPHAGGSCCPNDCPDYKHAPEERSLRSGEWVSSWMGGE